MIIRILRKLGIIKLRSVKLKPYLYDISKLERIVEYGWVLMNLGDCTTILDVGCWGTLFPIQLASLGYKVVGIDLREYPYSHPNFRFIRGDVFERGSLLPNQKFDVIILISTLEHMGILYHTEHSLYLNVDRRVLSILSRKLYEKGRMLITIPVGKFKVLERHRQPGEDFFSPILPWLKVYDRKAIERIIIEPLVLEKIEYFIERNGKWMPGIEDEAMEFDFPQLVAKIKSIACLKLRRK